MSFAGFTAADFDAYAPKKWASNVFNLERLQVRQKLEALGRALQPSLRGPDGLDLAFEVSTEHPALWNQHRVERQQLFFCREKRTRDEIDALVTRSRPMAALIEDPSPLHHQVVLAVTVDQHQVEVALKLHADAAVDRDNLLRKGQDFYQREKLLQALHGLRAGFTVAVGDAPERDPRSLTDDDLQRILQALPQSKGWFSARYRVDRDGAIGLGAELATLLAALLGELLPALHQISWRRDKDQLAVVQRLREQEVRQKARCLAKHDRVRVVRGVFQGKTGVVQGTDAKGGVKVQLGSMAVKLASDEVVKL